MCFQKFIDKTIDGVRVGVKLMISFGWWKWWYKLMISLDGGKTLLKLVKDNDSKYMNDLLEWGVIIWKGIFFFLKRKKNCLISLHENMI